MERLLNGGFTQKYKWGQTLEEVTVHLPLEDGVRARDLRVELKRASLSVARKAGGSGALLEGELFQPIRTDESTWMVEDGTLVLQLAKDNKRAVNVGPSTEWWHGIFAGEDTLDPDAHSVQDYVRADQLSDDQVRELSETRALEARAADEKRDAQAREAALPAKTQQGLAMLRNQFPDIPIEYGDSSMPAATDEGAAAGGDRVEGVSIGVQRQLG